jgi:PAS domain S-box-containing protein
MNKSISVLILEDHPEDAELMVHELRRTGYEPEWQRVDTEKGFRTHLDTAPDLILADYSLPGWDALRALHLLQDSALDIPFIIVTGSIEEAAVECMKQGADDYILKDRMARLGQAVTHALEDKRLRVEKQRDERELRESEVRYKAIVEDQTELICRFRPDGTMTFVNEAYVRYMGISPEDVIGDISMSRIPDEDQDVIDKHFSSLSQEHPVVTYEHRILQPDGSTSWQQLSARALYDENDSLYEYQTVGRDITRRKEAEAELLHRHHIVLALSKAGEDLQRAQTTEDVFHAVGDVMRDLDLNTGIFRLSDDQESISIANMNLRQDVLQEAQTLTGPSWENYQIPVESNSHFQQVVEEGKGTFVDDFSEVIAGMLPTQIRAIAPRLTSLLNIKHGITVPLLRDGRVHALFNVTGRDLVDSDLPVIVTFANQISVALENVQLLEETRRRYRELEALAQVSSALRAAKHRADMPAIILDRLSDLLSADGAALAWRETEESEDGSVVEMGVGNLVSWTGRRLSNNEGIIGHVIQSGQQCEIPNIKSAPRFLKKDLPSAELAVLCTPLKIEDETLGAILACRRSPFSNVENQLFDAVSDMAANALNRAQLMDTLEERVIQRTEELKVANERLEVLNRLKDEFVSNVSHELRTPITSLKLYNKLVADSHEKREEFIGRMKREIDRLATIIEDILRLSRLDQDRVELDLAPLDLYELAKVYVVDRELLAKEKNLQLNLDEHLNLPLVQADQTLIGQALSILLTNAMNYTPEGGRITISTLDGEFDGKLWTGSRVSDTGPGIEPDEQSRLFERFFRGKTGRESGVPGTGLGLAIVKEIVDRHSGRIEVESEGVPGKGTAFTVWLPAMEGEK